MLKACSLSKLYWNHIVKLVFSNSALLCFIFWYSFLHLYSMFVLYFALCILRKRRFENGDIVLYCNVLYCIVLYCIVLYCIVLYCIVLLTVWNKDFIAYMNKFSNFEQRKNYVLSITFHCHVVHGTKFGKNMCPRIHDLFLDLYSVVLWFW